jgi:hypothetical protein
VHSRKLALNFFVAVAIVAAISVSAFAATPLGTTFTYQGRLTESGAPVNGDADFQMSFWDGPDAGAAMVTPIALRTAAVVDGTFAVDLNFGAGLFNGDERWLQIAVRFPAGSGTFTTLTPRQRINAAPYALAMLGRFTQPNASSPNLIGGFAGNTVTPSVIGATISGGGNVNSVNSVIDDFGTVSGGFGNSAGNDSTVGGGVSNDAIGGAATVGGGVNNTANGSQSTVSGGGGNFASENHSTVGGGEFNAATEGHATVSGGQNNTANVINSTVGGGFSNVSSGPGLGSSTVGGGWDNTASGEFSIVGGGFQNTASGSQSAVGGGALNTASGGGSTVAGGGGNTASGLYSTVAGGNSNLAQGSYSFAGGRRAKANHNGSFVWGDSTDANVSSFATNTFTARAVNGFIFYTNSALTSGAAMGAGAGSWTSLSDQNRKRDIRPVDAQDILAKVAALPITSWSYDSQDPSIRHIGPMAQDFNPAFGIGEFENGITTIDADGVALAAIQGLHQTLTDEVSRLRETATAQATELAQLKAQLGELRALLESARQIEHNNTSAEQ